MTAVYRFEDLRVWQAAQRQNDNIGALIKRPKFMRDFKLVNQISGAGISVTNNICEGFLRRNDNEFLQFLRYAAGSNGEVRACLYVARGRDYIEQDEAASLIADNNSIGGMITRLQQYLGGTGPWSDEHEAGPIADDLRTKDEGQRIGDQGRRDQGPTIKGPRTNDQGTKD
jgi:four helix bundle protein